MTSNLLFIIFLLAIAAYVLYAAIVGKGRLYNAEFIKEELKAKFHKVLRLLYLTLGIVMLLETLVMVGQGYLYEQGGIYIAESYYEQDGTYHEITEKDGVFYENGAEVQKYSLDEFSAKYVDSDSQVLKITKSDPTKVNTEATPTPTPAASSMSCMGAGASAAVSDYPAVGYTSIVHKSETIFSSISYETLTVLNYVFMGLSMALLIALFVVIRVMTDTEKKAKARTTNAPSGLPSSAFDFDEDDK